MTMIHFDSQEQYGFAEQFFLSPRRSSLGIHLYPSERAIDTTSPVIERLLRRIKADKAVVLPFVSTSTDSWLIAGSQRRDLDYTLAQISHFIVPTYAGFPDGVRTPRLRLFSPEVNELQRQGAALYPAGYYRLHSLPTHRPAILQRLDLWMSLEERRPSAIAVRSRAYVDLYELFNAALVAANWIEAEQHIQEMRQLNMTTADNLAFLRIQLAASQQHWLEIWERSDFSLVARMRVPRMVRAAMLTAFYQSILLPLEQENKWEDAIRAFDDSRARLGLLMTGRFGLTQPSVVNVFAYQATISGDKHSFDELRSIGLSPELHRCFAALERLLPPSPTASPPEDPLRRAKQALADRNYDAADRAAMEIEDPEERTLLLIEIGYFSGDARIAEQALLELWSLPHEVQARIQGGNARIRFSLSYLEEITATSTHHATVSPPSVPPIQTWLDWFEIARESPESPELDASLTRLAATGDDRYWTPERASQLSDRLLEISASPALLRRSYTRQALRHLLTIFMDASFPREEQEYADVYEGLYICLFDLREINASSTMTLLRLAEAILRRTPQRCGNIQKDLYMWLAQPIPALEQCVLDAFELLAEYGTPGSILVDWYREWIEYLLALPSRRDRASLETWLSLGSWINPGDYIISRLRQQLERTIEQEVVSPLLTLPEGYRIAIFSLRESSSARAKDILLQSNPGLDVRLCREKDLNDQAKALAQSAQIPVIVTTCISHAITYGINPYLANDPVYPTSSGSSSIIRAIEERLQRLAVSVQE